MSSPPVAPPVARGAQSPRVLALPDSSVSSTGAEAVELAAMAGLVLDPWQAFVLEHSLGERADGSWAAFEVALIVSRQCGKGSILEARELAGLFLLGERLIIHSAHQFDTSLEQFRRLLFLIEDTPDLDRRVRRVSRSHGEEGIELMNGQRIRFRTRTKGGGRGFTADCLIFDEAMILPEHSLGAALFTLSARPNPQVWYTGSALDQDIVEENGIVLARVRERGHKGEDPGLAYFEWSLDCDHPSDVDERMAADPESWAQANPALGIRISEEYVAREREAVDPRTFAVERLGVGDWPNLDALGATISVEAWDGCADLNSAAEDPVCFALDVTPDRSAASIAVAGKRKDGKAHVEIVEHRRGTGWAPDRLDELIRRHRSVAPICDASGPAAALLPYLADLKIEAQLVNAKEHGQACGLFFDAVEQDRLRHLGTPELRAAVLGAKTRPLGDAWAWSRKTSEIDISPLVACTLALWGLQAVKPRKPGVVDLSAALRNAEQREQRND